MSDKDGSLLAGRNEWCRFQNQYCCGKDSSCVGIVDFTAARDNLPHHFRGAIESRAYFAGENLVKSKL
jgi:hypothetical protein